MQNERGDVVFGTSAVGGFNRQNVLDYIEKLQNRLTKSEAAEQAQYAQTQEMQTQLRTLRDALAQADAVNDDLQTQLRTLRDALAQANAVNGDLQTQLDAARLESRQARAEAERLRNAYMPPRRGKK